jgi:hypothetical protein
VNAIANVPLQQQQKRLDTTAFRLQMEAVPVLADGVLYALYGDPDQLEKGGHPYWLVSVRRNPYQAPQGLRDVQGKTINKGNWIVDALWYECTSEDPNHKAYHMLPGDVIHVRLSSFVTEVGLEWVHYSPGRQGTRATGIFSDASHLRVMRHNFSNVI